MLGGQWTYLIIVFYPLCTEALYGGCVLPTLWVAILSSSCWGFPTWWVSFLVLTYDIPVECQIVKVGGPIWVHKRVSSLFLADLSRILHSFHEMYVAQNSVLYNLLCSAEILF